MKETMDQKTKMTPALDKALRMVAATKLRRLAADHQGPHDFAGALMLFKYLREQAPLDGKSDSDVLDEVELMLEDPSRFKQEYADVQGREAPPVIDEDIAPAAPMPPIEETPPNANMPMPGPQGGPIQASIRNAADNAAKRCPKCKSGTTGVVKSNDEKTTCLCHACKNIFTIDAPLVPDAITSSRRSADEDPTEPKDDPKLHVERDDVPVQWQDLRVGHEYKMMGHRIDEDNYWADEPDIIKIIGPGDTESPIGDHFVYEIVNDFNMPQKNEMTRDDFERDRIELRSTNDGDDDGDSKVGPAEMLEEGNSDNTNYQGESEQTDLSTPTKVGGYIWGRFARGDEFMRPDELNKRPTFSRNDYGVPLIDSPYPNQFASSQKFAEAMSEWKSEHLYPALRHREARSLTKLIKSKIASGNPISDSVWDRIEELGGPHYAADDSAGMEDSFRGEPQPSKLDHWPSWRMPSGEEDAEVEDLFGDLPKRIVGRGAIMQPEGSEAVLHSWPVNMADRADNPKNERFHGQHLNELGFNPDTDGRLATFNINMIDGKPVVESDGDVFPLTDEDIALIKSYHRELDQDEEEGRFGKTAGAEFNLMQQKEFIGEQGIARNADKLDLSNTHYAETATENHFLFGL